MAPGITFQEIETNSIRLHSAVAGPADGPLAILLHGFPDFWYGWRAQIAVLARAGMRVLAPDLRGYNLSQKPPQISAYSLETLTLDVTGLISASHHQSAALIGHDWGGVVAWQAASAYPQRVSKLAILNAPEWNTMVRRLRKDWRQIMRSWYILFFQFPWLPEAVLRRQNFRSLSRVMASHQSSEAWAGQQARSYRRAWGRPDALSAMLNWYRMAFRRGLKGLLHPQPLSQIQVPTLVMWGMRDRALSPKLAQSSADLCLNGELVCFPNAGHWVHHEETDRVNRLLVDFLAPD
jgi:pimeloyl-ACP methyl ester carboxylesterase